MSLHQHTRDRVYTWLLSTIPPELSYLADNIPEDPALLLANVCNTLRPTDDKTIDELYDSISDFQLAHYKGDFVRMATDLKRTYLELRSMGERIGEKYITNQLIKALPHTSKYKTLITILRTSQSQGFDALVVTIRKWMRDEGLDKSVTSTSASSRSRDDKNVAMGINDIPEDTRRRIQNRSKFERQKRYLSNSRKEEEMEELGNVTPSEDASSVTDPLTMLRTVGSTPPVRTAATTLSSKLSRLSHPKRTGLACITSKSQNNLKLLRTSTLTSVMFSAFLLPKRS